MSFYSKDTFWRKLIASYAWLAAYWWLKIKIKVLFYEGVDCAYVEMGTGDWGPVAHSEYLDLQCLLEVL